MAFSECFQFLLDKGCKNADFHVILHLGEFGNISVSSPLFEKVGEPDRDVHGYIGKYDFNFDDVKWEKYSYDIRSMDEVYTFISEPIFSSKDILDVKYNDKVIHNNFIFTLGVCVVNSYKYEIAFSLIKQESSHLYLPHPRKIRDLPTREKGCNFNKVGMFTKKAKIEIDE